MLFYTRRRPTTSPSLFYGYSRRVCVRAPLFVGVCVCVCVFARASARRYLLYMSAGIIPLPMCVCARWGAARRGGGTADQGDGRTRAILSTFARDRACFWNTSVCTALPSVPFNFSGWFYPFIFYFFAYFNSHP